MRELANGKISEDSPVNIWSSIRGHFTTLLNVVRSNKPVKPPTATDREYDIIVAVDASTTGYGITAFEQDLGRVTSMGGRWASTIDPSDINVYEGKTLHIAAKALKEALRGKKALFLVDNTSVLYTSKKGRSAEFRLNCEIDGLLTTLAAVSCEGHIAYVDTKVNPSDANSRGQYTAPSSQLASALWALRGAVEEVKISSPNFAPLG
jgi:hypothetical protein